MSGVLIAALLLALGQTGSPPPAATALSSPAQVSTDALALSALLNPEEPTVAAGVHVFATGFRAALREGAEGAEVFTQYPGLEDALIVGCRPVVEKYTRKGLPRIREQTARFFADRFTAAELRQLVGFYGSPTGAKLVLGTIAGMDGADAMPGYVSRGGEEIRSEDISNLLGGSLMRILPSFNDQDKAALLRFGQTPVFKKMQKLQPELMAFNTKLANEPDPEFDAALDKVIEDVTTDFITKHEATKRTG